jgi:large subunit ribosomal protein L24
MSNNKVRIHQGDTVLVLAGKDRGKVGTVTRVVPEDRRVAVEGVALVKRHTKSTSDQPGSIVFKERLIDVSNVALWDTQAGRRVKVGYRVLEDGRKVRVDRKTGSVIDKG